MVSASTIVKRSLTCRRSMKNSPHVDPGETVTFVTRPRAGPSRGRASRTRYSDVRAEGTGVVDGARCEGNIQEVTPLIRTLKNLWGPGRIT